MSRPILDGLPTFRTCSHPGCDRRMWKGSGTYDVGLCKDHGGAKKGKAQVRVFVPPEQRPERPGVRVAEVPVGGFSGSGSEMGVMRVSLAREPWG